MGGSQSVSLRHLSEAGSAALPVCPRGAVCSSSEPGQPGVQSSSTKRKGRAM